MMYESKLAAAIKVAGKVLREFDKDKVYLPFGSEYSIYLKNMHTRRCVAHVKIDGTDVGDGRGFVVPAGGTIDIERFISNGNLDEGNRFKFIERTGKVEAHRGIGVEDGLVSIEFQFEREPVRVRHFVDPHIYGGSFRGGETYDSYSVSNSVLRGSGGMSVNSATTKGFTANETGVTAPGSLSDQSFSDAGYIPLEYTKHSMVLHLLGETADNLEVREAVTVKHKPKCVSCGTINRHDAKFCSECGTALHIV